jgi:hypothetical protein
MPDRKLSRREALAVLGTAVAGTSAAVYGVTRATSDPESDAGRSTGGQQTSTPGSEVSPDDPAVVDITEFGARLNGESDDTEALVAAMDALGSDSKSVLFIPEGELSVSAQDIDRQAVVDFTGGHRDVTIQGAGPGRTRISMASGHEANHFAFRAHDGTDVSGLTIRDIHLDGNGLKQEDQHGFGIEIRGDGVTGVTIENCRISHWATNGCNINVGVRFHNCSFLRNGQRAAQFGRDGHGINAYIGPNEELVVENCLFRLSTGTAIDCRQGSIRMESSVVDECTYGFKQQPTTDVTVNRCRFSNISDRPWYIIPDRGRVGTVRCTKTTFENIGWGAFDFPSPATFIGDDILIKNSNQEVKRDAALFARNGSQFEFGRLSVHNTNGAVLDLEECEGYIEELIHSNNPGGIGERGDVTLRSTTEGGPIDIDVPVAEDVGVSLNPD